MTWASGSYLAHYSCTACSTLHHHLGHRGQCCSQLTHWHKFDLWPWNSSTVTDPGFTALEKHKYCDAVGVPTFAREDSVKMTENEETHLWMCKKKNQTISALHADSQMVCVSNPIQYCVSGVSQYLHHHPLARVCACVCLSLSVCVCTGAGTCPCREDPAPVWINVCAFTEMCRA